MARTWRVAGEIVSSKTLEQMWTPFELNDGSNGACGLGFFIEELGGKPLIQHSGGIFGWRTFTLFVPEDEIFVAVLTNCQRSGNVPVGLAKAVARQLSALE